MSLEDRIWLISIRDEETGIILQGTFEADSEIEARGKIVLAVERMFLGAQRIDFDRIPEEFTGAVGAMHKMAQSFDPGAISAYHIGGSDAEG